MRRFSRTAFLLVTAALLAAAPQALAQNPTGTITGNVTDRDGAVLPGVTVTATSANLQGTRVVITGDNGSYKLAFLPPGQYRITYELDGFGTANRDLRVAAALTNTLDVTLDLAALTEEIVVTGDAGTISESTTGASSYTQREVEMLPIARDLDDAVELAAGTHASGPRNSAGEAAISISGGMSFDNLWTLNGVVINENVRGQELPLFIEDAVQETTTQVSGISAEYGRFAGGVINAISKSGGNELSGSFRDNVVNDDWVSRNDLSPERVDDLSHTYEATLGGYLWKDHLWFFAAGRDRDLTETTSLNVTNIGVVQNDEQTRVEGKLTGTLADSHTVIGSYLEIDQVSTNDFFPGNIDPAGLTDREDPQEIKSINYTGILTPSFFVEAQYSERDFEIGKGSGAKSRTLVDGTLMRTRQSGAFRYYTPTFCGVCEQELRNNEDILAKGSYFLSTEGLGTHDLVFGADQFSDVRFSVNHQTGSDFTAWDSDFTVRNDGIFPTLAPVGNDQGLPATWIGWWAVFNPEKAQPTNFETTSFFVNDRWQLDENWSFNLGVRYDATDGTNGGGAKVLDDQKVSPRLGLSWDVGGNGDLVLTANAGTYVAGITNSLADSTSTGGAIGVFISEYGGPAVNLDCRTGGPCVPTRDALRTLFDWYLANGGTTDVNGDLSNLPNLISVSIPGETAIIRDTLKSPSADELTLGATKRIGNRGLVRADVVYRDFSDFYSNQTTLETGQVDTATGPADLTLVGNFGNDTLEREYLGLHLQARFRVNDRLTLSGNYTLSELEGNIDGETAAAGPVPASPQSYPEYHDNRWMFPVGNLNADQRHKVRAWAIYDLIDTEHHSLNASLLQNFFSGSAYSLFAGIDTAPYVTNPGYATPPTATSTNYFFSDRGQFTFDDITRTDLALNYAFQWNAFGRPLEIFLQPEVLNIFDEDGLENFDTRIRTASQANQNGACPQSPRADKRCIAFNPFTETPVEGVHWAKRSTFGQPLQEVDYQAPRTFRFSLGFRF